MVSYLADMINLRDDCSLCGLRALQLFGLTEAAFWSVSECRNLYGIPNRDSSICFLALFCWLGWPFERGMSTLTAG